MLTLLCGSGNAVYARSVENPTSTIGVGIMKKGSIFQVYYKGTRSSDVKVAIFNDKGGRVFFEVIRKIDGFVRPYNFSDLAEGRYTFEISDGITRQSHVGNYRMQEPEQSVAPAHLTRVGNENKFLLTVPGRSPRVVFVSIYGEKGQLLYREQLHHITEFARFYNLNAYAGIFYLSLSMKEEILRS